MAQKYLNVNEAAKALGISDADVKQMLDKRELYGYRDGADWKFKVEDIDRLVQERSSSDADDGYNVLASEVELGHSDPGLSGTVIGSNQGKSSAESDIRLADDDIHLAEEKPRPSAKQPARPQADDSIHLAESGVNLGGSDVRLADTDIHLAESGIDLTGGKPAAKKDDVTSKVSQFEELDMTLDQDLTLEDSGVAINPPPKKAAPGDSAVDLSGQSLDDDDLVLGGGSGAGSDIAISGDSGISLVDPADSGLSLDSELNLGTTDESLELGEDDLLAGGEGMKSEDDFQLTPMEDFSDGEDSESGSQVIALDTEGEGDEAATMLGTGAGVAMLDDELGGDPSMGLAALPLGAGGLAASDALAVGAPFMDSTAALPEAPYSILNIVSLVLVSLLLILVGMMMYELLRDMWEWTGSPVAPNTWLMDTIVSLIDK